MKKKKVYKKPLVKTEKVKLGVFGCYGNASPTGNATFIFRWGQNR